MKARVKRYQSGGLSSKEELRIEEKTPKESSLRFSPQFVALDKGFKGVGGRLSYTKDLDKNSSIQAYADAMTGKPSGQPAFLLPQRVGLEYRRSFAKGGAVSASKRADGIAKKGKTKGRIV